MYLPIAEMKTYEEWYEEYPDFYDSRIEAGAIDQATVNSIFDWFRYRHLCDNDKFSTFFGRQLDISLPRYNKLIRLENTDFDAMVNTYRERQLEGSSAETGSVDTEKTSAGTSNVDSGNTTVRTPNITVADTGSNSSTTDSDSSTSGTSSSTSNSESNTSSVSKQNPQSISYEQSTVGEVPPLNWQYPSSQQQTDSENENTTSSTSSGTSSTDTTQSGTTSNTQTTTGTETTVFDGSTDTATSETVNGSVDSTKSKTNMDREIWTGRDNLTPQEALTMAMQYVRKSSAFVWLLDQLNSCFLSIYDI